MGHFARLHFPAILAQFFFLVRLFVVQGTCCSRAVCRLLFVVNFRSQFLTTRRRGWAPAPAREGLVQTIRGPPPPAVRWPKADAWPVVGRNSSDAKPMPIAGSNHGRWRQERSTKSPEIVVEEAKKKVAGIEAALEALSPVGATEGAEVQLLKESSQKGKRATRNLHSDGGFGGKDQEAFGGARRRVRGIGERVGSQSIAFGATPCCGSTTLYLSKRWIQKSQH